MDRPWEPDETLTAPEAARLIERRFPTLAPVRAAPLAAGWDNTAFLVNDRYVFRFPRREIAVELLATETRLLPAIAPRLPLPVPVPHLVGAAGDDFPWPFAGHELVAGRTACTRRLPDPARDDAAAPLAAFLAALHGIGAEEARRLGAPPDTIGRLDLPMRIERLSSRVADGVAAGAIDPEEARLCAEIVEETPTDWTPAPTCLCHGDLYARHLLVDDDDRLAGVIDWGDAHVGDPAVDLAIVYAFLPPAGRRRFFDAYGETSDAVKSVARFRALLTAILLLVYGADVGDDDLRHEGRWTLANLSRRP